MQETPQQNSFSPRSNGSICQTKLPGIELTDTIGPLLDFPIDMRVGVLGISGGRFPANSLLDGRRGDVSLNVMPMCEGGLEDADVVQPGLPLDYH